MILIHLIDRYGEQAPEMFSIENTDVEFLTPTLLNQIIKASPTEIGIYDLKSSQFMITKCKTCAHFSGEEQDVLLSVV